MQPNLHPLSSSFNIKCSANNTSNQSLQVLPLDCGFKGSFMTIRLLKPKSPNYLPWIMVPMNPLKRYPTLESSNDPTIDILTRYTNET